MNSKEHLIQRAKLFLESDSLSQTPIDEKIRFLKNKGLTVNEINDLLRQHQCQQQQFSGTDLNLVPGLILAGSLLVGSVAYALKDKWLPHAQRLWSNITGESDKDKRIRELEEELTDLKKSLGMEPKKTTNEDCVIENEILSQKTELNEEEEGEEDVADDNESIIGIRCSEFNSSLDSVLKSNDILIASKGISMVLLYVTNMMKSWDSCYLRIPVSSSSFQTSLEPMNNHVNLLGSIGYIFDESISAYKWKWEDFDIEIVKVVFSHAQTSLTDIAKQLRERISEDFKDKRVDLKSTLAIDVIGKQTSKPVPSFESPKK
eukprot:TRINITY_DN249409_c2_g1_i1.p1 TRINITY_DN249409_c2_g1~~TRINITY_DN249409_c2_g1_i1.p1  ORF type:complete len:318 (-),score=85.05 TRINITY_DN249409_c2_g1_i1:242-1195(-)